VQGIQHDAFLLSAQDTSLDIPTAELVQKYWSHLPWRGDLAAYVADNPYRTLVDASHAAQVLGWQARRSWRDEIQK